MISVNTAMKRIAALPLPQDQRDAIAKAVAEHYAATTLYTEKRAAMRDVLKPAAALLCCRTGHDWALEVGVNSLEYALTQATHRIKYIHADKLPKERQKALRKKRSELLAQLEVIDHELEAIT